VNRFQSAVFSFHFGLSTWMSSVFLYLNFVTMGKWSFPYACDKVSHVRWGAKKVLWMLSQSLIVYLDAVPKWVGLPLFSVIRFRESKTDSIIFPFVFVVMQPHDCLWLLKLPRIMKSGRSCWIMFLKSSSVKSDWLDRQRLQIVIFCLSWTDMVASGVFTGISSEVYESFMNI